MHAMMIASLSGGSENVEGGVYSAFDSMPKSPQVLAFPISAFPISANASIVFHPPRSFDTYKIE
jgi:hypothetical protein